MWRPGHDGWREATTWPPPEARELCLYLACDRATADAEAGSLAERPDAARAAVTWTHVANSLVPSTVANPFAFPHEFPDEQIVQSRPDVLTFTSEPWQRSVDLAGPIRLRVGATSCRRPAAVHRAEYGLPFIPSVAPTGVQGQCWPCTPCRFSRR